MVERITTDARIRRQRASEEAAAWWTRLHFEELARVDREQFVDWLRESSLHVAEMLRLDQTHRALQRFQAWSQINTNAPAHDAPAADHPHIVPLVSSKAPVGASDVTKRE
jgi:ferric-dicitrate binding protein FerR (iron transport regulator)